MCCCKALTIACVVAISIIVNVKMAEGVLEILGQVEKVQRELAGPQEKQGQVRVVFPPRERKIQKFSCTVDKDGEFYPLSDFLVNVKSVWDARQEATPAEKAGVIIVNIEDLAREEVKCLSAEAQIDPDKVEATLKAAFSERLTVSQLMVKYYSRRQGSQWA